MSDEIIVRVTLGSYDVLHPSVRQAQVYVQIPEVARATWLLDEGMHRYLTSTSWPDAVASAQEWHAQSGAVSDPSTAAARAAIVMWLQDDAHHDEMYDAWELDQARRHPVARKLLSENERLRVRITELEGEVLALSTPDRAAASAAKLTALLGPTPVLAAGDES